RLLLSGTRLRQALYEGAEVPAEFSRPEVLQLLRKFYSFEAAGAAPHRPILPGSPARRLQRPSCAPASAPTLRRRASTSRTRRGPSSGRCAATSTASWPAAGTRSCSTTRSAPLA